MKTFHLQEVYVCEIGRHTLCEHNYISTVSTRAQCAKNLSTNACFPGVSGCSSSWITDCTCTPPHILCGVHTYACCSSVSCLIYLCAVHMTFHIRPLVCFSGCSGGKR